MLTKLRQLIAPTPPPAPAAIPGVTREEVLTVRALIAYSEGSTAADAMAVFRGDAA